MLTEDATMLKCISHLLEQAIDKNMFPTIEQDLRNVSKKSSSIKIPLGKDQVPAHVPAKEPERPTKSFDMVRRELGTCEVVNATKRVGQEESASLKKSTPPSALLIQRTLALGEELTNLNRGIYRSAPDPQNQSQWLAIGGELEELRSLSPPLKQDTTGISRLQAHRMGAEILPLELANQDIIVPSDDSENGDLIMLDGQPKDVTFRLRKKRFLSPANQETPTMKRPKFSAVVQGGGYQSQISLHGLTHQNSTNPEFGPSTRAREITRKHLDKLRADLKQFQDDLEHKKHHADVKDLVTRIMRQKAEIGRFEGKSRAQAFDHDDQSFPINTFKHEIVLPTNTPMHVLGNQGIVDVFGPLPPPSAFTAEELRKRQKQLEDLEDHLQDQGEQIHESTLRGKQEEISKLRTDVERCQGVVEAQHEIEAREECSNGRAYEPDPASWDVLRQLKPSMCYYKSPFTELAGTSYTGTIPKEQSGNVPMENTQPRKSSQHAFHQIPYPSRRPTRNVVDRMILLMFRLLAGFVDENVVKAASALKQFPRNMTTEPKALRRVPTEPKAMRPAQRSCRQWVAGPRAVTDGPITRQHASQLESSSNAAPTSSLATPDQIPTSNGLIHCGETGLQIDHDYQLPLHAVASSPPPIRNDDTVGIANSNVPATISRPVGPWGYATHAVSAMLDLSDELNGIFDNATCGTDTYAQKVVRSPCSDDSNTGGELK